jgi:hypothetical protein
MTCHYCRDAATTTAGGRDVCDDCQAAYEQQIENAVRLLIDEAADEISFAARFLIQQVEKAR